MAKTSAERKRLQRERIKKNGTYQDYLSKQKLLMSKKRSDEKSKVSGMKETVKNAYVSEQRKKGKRKKGSLSFEKGSRKSTRPATTITIKKCLHNCEQQGEGISPSQAQSTTIAKEKEDSSERTCI